MGRTVTIDEIPRWFAAKLLDRRIETARVDGISLCWETNLRPQNKDGYVAVRVPGLGEVRWAIHRLSYVIGGGVLDPELEILHLCNNRGCYRPEHLEQGTHRKNMQMMDYSARVLPKRAQCKNGHPFTEDNVMYSKGGTVRRCRKCRSEKMKGYKRTYLNKLGGE